MSQVAISLASRLGELVSTARVIADPASLAGYEVDGCRPSAALQPSAVSEIAETLRFASAERLAVIPTGGRTHLHIGMPPHPYDLALDLSGMNRVLAFEPQDLTLGVEPGTTYAELDRTLREYSTGMKRKLGLIQALQADPPLLILDEPTEGLDPLVQIALNELLSDLRSRGRTMFMSDTVLQQEEVNPVITAAQANGIEVTAVHNHFMNEEPRIFFMHLHGHGETAGLSDRLRSEIGRYDVLNPGIHADIRDRPAYQREQQNGKNHHDRRCHVRTFTIPNHRHVEAERRSYAQFWPLIGKRLVNLP